MKLLELETSERFCQDVGDHFVSRTVGNGRNVVIDNFANEMEAGIGALGAHVKC